MFIGQYTYSLDAKGRVVIPPKYREELGEEFVISKGMDGCLRIYTTDAWQDFCDKLSALPQTSKDARHFARFFLAGANSLEPDKQGRVLIPQVLREFASLEKDVMIIGVNNYVEIWDVNKYDEVNDISEEELDEISEKMFENGFIL